MHMFPNITVFLKPFLASLKLVNVEEETQIVAIREKAFASGAYGEVYKGTYLIKEGKDYDPVGDVVAKRNKSSSSATRDEVRRTLMPGQVSTILN